MFPVEHSLLRLRSLVPGRLDNPTFSKHTLQYLVTGQIKRLKHRISGSPLDTLQEASRWAASVIMARLCAKYPPAKGKKMHCLVPQAVRIGVEKSGGTYTKT